MKSERLQVLIEPAQRERLERASADRGVSVGTLVRDAIDTVLPPRDGSRARAAAAILELAPMDVPDPDVLCVELDHLRARE